jgi:hypothetical protein
MKDKHKTEMSIRLVFLIRKIAFISILDLQFKRKRLLVVIKQYHLFHDCKLSHFINKDSYLIIIFNISLFSNINARCHDVFLLFLCMSAIEQI